MSDYHIRQHIAAKKRREETKAAMMALIDSTNVMNGEEDMAQGMLDALVGSHRTLQQSFFRVFAEAMKQYSETNNDLRNQASVDFAKRINKLEHIFPFI